MINPQKGVVMPWSTNTVSELRLAFVHAVRTAGRSVTQAAQDFGISRKTAYKWLARFDAQQPLTDQSTRPQHSPARTSEQLEAAVLAVRDQHGWGPRKIVAYLRNQNQPTIPARTAAAVLQRHKRIAHQPLAEVADQRFERSEPNQLWQVDFKGYVEVARKKVYPLTVLDDHSRFLLALGCGEDVTMARAWNVLWNVFGEYGLPEAILCDNAFGSSGRGVSWFEARLMRLGVRVTHGRPYHPQTQGKVERLHGTLESEVFPRLDRGDRLAFEAGLDRWRREVYNVIRPHESLGDLPPVCRWRVSERVRPRVLPAVEYPAGSVLRRASAGGVIRWRNAKLLAGNGVVGQWVRIEETGTAVELWYGPYRIRQIPLDQLQNSGLL
jgi:transposase InsO family protein